MTTKTRITILERVLPSLSFGLAAVAGMVGSVLAYLTHREVSTMDLPSYHIMETGVAFLDLVEIPLLSVAALIAFASAVISFVRNITRKEGASPPGVYIAALGVLSLASIGFLLLALYMPYDAFGRAPGAGRSGQAAGWVVPTLATSFLFALFAAASAAVFVAVPIKVRPARRFGPAVLLFLFAAIFLVLSIVFFFQWQAMTRPLIVY